jgi:hypothetical protein
MSSIKGSPASISSWEMLLRSLKGSLVIAALGLPGMFYRTKSKSMAHALALRNTQKPPSTNGPETWTYHFCSQCLLINESSKNGGYKTIASLEWVGMRIIPDLLSSSTVGFSQIRGSALAKAQVIFDSSVLPKDPRPRRRAELFSCPNSGPWSVWGTGQVLGCP